MENCLQKIDNPPSKENMGPIAITELSIMGIVLIVCIVDMFRAIFYLKDEENEWEVIDFLKVVEYCLIFIGIILTLTSFFWNLSSILVILGAICFCICSIIAFTILILLIGKGRDIDNLAYNAVYLGLLVLLSFVLYRQSNSLY